MAPKWGNFGFIQQVYLSSHWQPSNEVEYKAASTGMQKLAEKLILRGNIKEIKRIRGVMNHTLEAVYMSLTFGGIRYLEPFSTKNIDTLAAS